MVAVIILGFFKIKNLQNIFTAFNFLSWTEKFELDSYLRGATRETKTCEVFENPAGLKLLISF